MKKSSKRIFALIILFVSVVMFSMLAVSASVESTAQTFSTNDDTQIEAKYKKSFN